MSYEHLTLKERYVIYHLVLYGLTFREIGRRLGRSHSTISREVRRNGPPHGGAPYVDKFAHERAINRRHWPRARRRHDDPRLRCYVTTRLCRDWSPEQIAGRLLIDYRGDHRMRVRAETIYQWVYRDAAEGGALYRHLRRHHRRRHRQGRYGTGRGLFADRVGISERPPIVAARGRFGDWEADTLEGARGQGGLGTFLERRSRYLLSAPLENGSAETMANTATRTFRTVPRSFRKTMTTDNGREFADFKIIEQRTGFAVYFADPYASWQRGANENANGLLRQYFPKGSDLRGLTKDQLDVALKRLNHRPRKCLRYKTPHEVFFAAQRGALVT